MKKKKTPTIYDISVIDSTIQTFKAFCDPFFPQLLNVGLKVVLIVTKIVKMGHF